eukprot:156694-Hanusia_phi.AAC.5
MELRGAAPNQALVAILVGSPRLARLGREGPARFWSTTRAFSPPAAPPLEPAAWEARRSYSALSLQI